MTADDSRYLELFPAWLSTLGEDALHLSKSLGDDVGEEAKGHIVGGLNYIFKSLDLIPDGIDDLGFLDDAFVLRVAASFAKEAGAKGDAIERLASDCAPLQEFLKADYERLETYVRGLGRSTARGRTVEDILSDEGTKKTFVSEVEAWSKDFQKPSFTREPKTLVKLRSFLSAKLP